MASRKEKDKVSLLPDELKKRFPDQFPEVIEHRVIVRLVVEKWVMRHPQTGEDIELEAVPQMRLVSS